MFTRHAGSSASGILEQVFSQKPVDFSSVIDLVKGGGEMVHHVRYVLENQRDLVIDCSRVTPDQSFFTPSLWYMFDPTKSPIVALNVPEYLIARWEIELKGILNFEQRDQNSYLIKHWRQR